MLALWNAADRLSPDDRSRVRARPAAAHTPTTAPRHAQPSGRFFATPTRRGKPAASARASGRRRGRRVAPAAPPPSCAATRATASRSAVGPSQRIAIPPGARAAASTRRRSAAARAPSRARRRSASTGCSSARPHTTRAFGGAQCSQEVALAPLRLEQRELALGQRERERDAGRAAARADVDDGTVDARARASHRAQRVVEQHRPRLAPRRGSPSAPASRGPRASQSVCGEDDDVAIRLRPLGRRLDAARTPSASGARPSARPRSSARARRARRSSRTCCAVRTASASSVARRRSR